MNLASAIKEDLAERMLQKTHYRDWMHRALQVIKEVNPYLEIIDPYRKIDEGRFKIPFLDVVYQTARTPDHLEMLIAGEMWQLLAQGRIIYTTIPIQHTPFPDRDQKRNQMALNKLVRASQATDGLFTAAKFWGGKYGEDGVIVASRPFVASNGFNIFQDRVIEVESVAGIQTTFPLEVGSITPSRLRSHLEMSGCFARWPYGLNYIFFFEMVGWRHPIERESQNYLKESIVNVGPDKKGRPGPKPEFGRVKKRRSANVSDECFAWGQKLGGIGYVLEALYHTEKGRALMTQLAHKAKQQQDMGINLRNS